MNKKDWKTRAKKIAGKVVKKYKNEGYNVKVQIGKKRSK